MRRILGRSVGDDVDVFSGAVLQQPFSHGSVDDPEFFPLVVGIAEGLAGRTFARLVPVSLRQLNRLGASVELFQNFGVNQFLDFWVGNAEVIAGGGSG